ncbi:hypothetical protein DXG01_011285, partial [Tephrocybe rancida]
MTITFRCARRSLECTFDRRQNKSSLSPAALSAVLSVPIGLSSGTINVPLTTAYGDSSFTTLLEFDISPQASPILGLDWFYLFREHLIYSGYSPPALSQFNLDNFVATA